MEYDIFISCKSEDYKYGTIVLNFLQKNGIKPFLADKKLRELGLADYGKVIDDALEHSEHLVIVATKISYIEESTSPYVYYEWHTFSEEKKSGRKKGNIMTIVSNKEMINSLPIALRNFQSFLLNDYKNIIGYIKPSPSVITDDRDLAIRIHSWECLLFTIVCLILTSILFIPQKCHLSPNSKYDDNDAKLTPVDLDLPSGTLWSDRNLGAKEVTDFGDLYVWGGKDPIMQQDDFDSYKKKNPQFKDAAMIISGGLLRIPTKVQFDELIDCCVWKLDSLHNGFILISKKMGIPFSFHQQDTLLAKTESTMVKEDIIGHVILILLIPLKHLNCFLYLKNLIH